jgi:DNA-3-methyladenine glycosylase II
MSEETASSFILEPLAPFRLDLTAWALRRRPGNTIDRYDGHTYRRVLRLTDAVADVEVCLVGPPEAPRLAVSVATDRPARNVRAEVTTTLHRMLGLDVDLGDFYERAARDRQLGPLVERYRGLKPPRFPTIFECLTNAVACQQLTLTVGIKLLNRLTDAYGPNALDGRRGFPDPTDLEGADTGALRQLGFSSAKARSLLEAAHRLAGGELDLADLEAAHDDAASMALRELRGIGRWSAEYTLLRGLGRLGVFPADDVGARNNLRRIIELDAGIDYEGIRHAVSRWAPYSGLVYFHLLLDRIDEAGWLSTPPARGQARTPDNSLT